MELRYGSNCHTISNIATITGHDRDYVRRRLKDVKPAYYVDKTALYKLLDWQMYILPKEYDGYLTVQQIATIYSISITTTRKMLRDVEPIVLIWRKARSFLYTAEMVDKVFKDKSTGLISIPEASERLGMDIRTLHRMMNRHWRDAPLRADIRERIGKKNANLYKEDDLLRFIQEFRTEYYIRIDQFCLENDITYLEFQRLCTKTKLNWRRRLSEENWAILGDFLRQKREKDGKQTSC